MEIAVSKPHDEPGAPKAPHTLAKSIPSDTPPSRLHVLADRYRRGTDPVVRAMPPDYRRAILDRLNQLIARSPATEAA
jgi:hypothetical protein